jgi:hypothetical protein
MTFLVRAIVLSLMSLHTVRFNLKCSLRKEVVFWGQLAEKIGPRYRLKCATLKVPLIFRPTVSSRLRHIEVVHQGP